jgi:hypothetical protein
MSYRCYVCGNVVTGDVRCLFSHLRSVHFVCEMRGVTLKCGQGDCVPYYKSFNSLARHLHHQHSGHRAGTNCALGCTSNGDDLNVRDPGHVTGIGDSYAGPAVPARRLDSSSAAATFVASLLSSSSVTQTTVQSVIEHTGALIGDIVQDITDEVTAALQSANVLTNFDTTSLQNRLKQHANPFEPLNTQHRRTKLFKQQFGLVEARTFFLEIVMISVWML